MILWYSTSKWSGPTFLIPRGWKEVSLTYNICYIYCKTCQNFPMIDLDLRVKQDLDLGSLVSLGMFWQGCRQLEGARPRPNAKGWYSRLIQVFEHTHPRPCNHWILMIFLSSQADSPGVPASKNKNMHYIIHYIPAQYVQVGLMHRSYATSYRVPMLC